MGFSTAGLGAAGQGLHSFCFHTWLLRARARCALLCMWACERVCGRVSVWCALGCVCVYVHACLCASVCAHTHISVSGGQVRSGGLDPGPAPSRAAGSRVWLQVPLLALGGAEKRWRFPDVGRLPPHGLTRAGRAVPWLVCGGPGPQRVSPEAVTMTVRAVLRALRSRTCRAHASFIQAAHRAGAPNTLDREVPPCAPLVALGRGGRWGVLGASRGREGRGRTRPGPQAHAPMHRGLS